MTKLPYILVVEDDKWQAEQYVRILSDAGMRVKVASHALAAIGSIDAALPDAIVLDVLLAGLNAFALLHELRSHSDLATVPIILCTTIADRLSQEDLQAYGVRLVLDKTIMKPEDLVVAIKKVLP